MSGPKPIRHRGLVLRWHQDSGRWQAVLVRSEREPLLVMVYPSKWDGYHAVVEHMGCDVAFQARSAVGVAIDAALSEAAREIESELRACLRVRKALQRARGSAK